jgi:hypothetical protein
VRAARLCVQNAALLFIPAVPSGSAAVANLLSTFCSSCVTCSTADIVLCVDTQLSDVTSFSNEASYVPPSNAVGCVSGRRVLVHGDLGGKDNILVGDSIGHCDKKEVHINMCLILNGYRHTAV